MEVQAYWKNFKDEVFLDHEASINENDLKLVNSLHSHHRSAYREMSHYLLHFCGSWVTSWTSQAPFYQPPLLAPLVTSHLHDAPWRPHFPKPGGASYYTSRHDVTNVGS